MEAEMSAASSLNDSGDSVDGAANDVTSEEFSCIICRGSEHSLEVVDANSETTNNPVQQLMCEIVLVQSSNVLGNRLSNDQKKHPIKPNSTIRELETCRKNMLAKQSLTEKCFPNPTLPDFKFFEGDFDWDMSPHVSSCGHHVHFTCHKDYLKWVKQTSAFNAPYHDEFGFPCPLCRQVSSHVLPCNNKKLSNSSKLRNFDFSNCDSIIEKETQLKRLCADLYERIEDSSNRSHDESEINSTIINQITQELHLYWTPPGVLTDHDFEHIPILRGNLEYELLQRNGTLLPLQRNPQIMPKVPRKIPITSLFHMICQNTNITRNVLEMASIIWSKLYNPSSSNWQDKIPMLCKDPIELVLKLCCVIYPVSLVEFKLIVRMLYVLAVVQALVQMACKFSSTERRAWKSYASVSLGGVPFDAQKLECLLGYVISCLPSSLFSEERESAMECLTSTVYSPQSVNCCVQDQLLHFLRISSLLQHHLFDIDLPQLTNNSVEFAQLSKYLDLTPEINNDLVTSSILWPNSPRVVIQSWCKELSSLMEELQRRNCTSSKQYINLLTAQTSWSAPRLIDLPDSYNVIFQQYRQVHCADCGKQSRESALCLVCGRFVCYRGKCANPDNGVPSPNSVKSHLQSCGNGTCVLLIVNLAIVKVIKGKRICDWGTLYLDQHGEEDREWKRGKPLFLRRERLDMLTAQWRCHMFDDSHRFWLYMRE